jgi:hypothetical protein
MHISFERSGGVTGMPVTVALDTESLSSEEVSQLYQLIESSSFFELPAAIPAPVQPDRFQYKVIVREGDRQHTVTIAEPAVPKTLKSLLDWLIEAARRHQS